jgi:thymidylate synthase (FAD)
MVSGVNTLKVDLVDKMGSDLTVVNAARVSFAKKSDWDHSIPFADGNELKDTDARLIKYLAKHNHWSPFAHASLQFRIKAPIFVARQLVKHQVCRRYTIGNKNDCRRNTKDMCKRVSDKLERVI